MSYCSQIFSVDFLEFLLKRRDLPVTSIKGTSPTCLFVCLFTLLPVPAPQYLTCAVHPLIC